MKASKRTCISCQKPIPAGAMFCPACGEATPTEISKDDAVPRAPALDPNEIEYRGRLQAALGGGFELRELLGRGGFGSVYVAWDVKLEREVAVKALRHDLFPSPDLLDRFRREARAVARLRHSNILPIHFVGEGEGLAFMAMPKVEGESLRSLLDREGRLSKEEALRIATATAKALQAAHDAGLVHRDVKPENILLAGSERDVLLMDFGIAKAAEGTGTAITASGMIVGTPSYMSPEQASGKRDVDSRCDIYALGCVLYEMLAGDPPFTGSNTQAIISRHIADKPPPLEIVRAGIPGHITTAVTRALEKIPADRFATAIEFAEALRRPDSAAERAPSGVTRPPRVLRTVGLVSVISVSLLAAVSLTLSMLQSREVATQPGDSPPVARADAERLSIAVLPFLDLSAAGDQEYFSDGISEELLNLLAGIPEFRVTSRRSAFSFKGRDIDLRTITQRLNVNFVLEGSVRIAGNNARISVQLVDAVKDTQIWAHTYDRYLADIFAIQDDIASQVAGALRVTLLGTAPRSRRTDTEAYGLYLQGKHVAHQVTAENLERAIELYERSLALDSGYVPAWDAMASAFINQANSGLTPARVGYERAREAAQRAIQIDPEFARSYGRLGWVAMYLDRDLKAAARHYQRALALDPTDVMVLNGAAILAHGLGRGDDAIAILEQVIALDPVFPTGHANLGIRYTYAGQWDAAVASFRTTLALAPDYIGAQFLLGLALLMKGDREEALAAIQQESFEPFLLIGLALAHYAMGNESEADTALAKLIERHASGWAYNIAYVFAYRGELDAAFEWLELAVEHQDSGLADVAVEPLFANLFDDPRWQEFLERMGKSEEQLSQIEFRVSLP